MALKLSKELNEGESSGRVASMMADAELGAASPAKPSIYRNTTPTTNNNSATASSSVFNASSYASRYDVNSSNSGNSGGSSSFTESREARESMVM